MYPEQDGLHQDEAAPHIARMGLLCEPFAGSGNGPHFFFADANREQRLDLMQHLAPYSEVLVVIGVPGVGKTTLMQQFVSRASDTWGIAVVSAYAGMGPDDFLGDVLAGFGLDADAQSSADEQRAALVAHLRALRQSAQAPILLVDDAHQLDAAVLEQVLALCEENDAGHLLSVILFGNPQLQSTLVAPALAPLQGRIAHTFDVPALDDQETARYIRHRMRAAGAQGEGPFNQAVVNKIYEASAGIPSAINEMAHHFLSDTPTVAPAERRGPVGGGLSAPGGMDKRWIVVGLAGVAVVVLLVAGRFGGGDGDELAQHTNELALPPPARVESGSRVLRDDTTLALGESPETAVPEALVEEPPVSADVSGVTDVPAPTPPPVAPADPSPTTPVVPPKVVETLPSPPPAVSARAPARDALKREDWLRAQPPESLTLQLMALKDEKKVRRLIEQHGLQDQAAYFFIKRKGLYAMVYGVYPSRTEAQRAAKKLPAGLISGQPWLRSIKSIHEEIGG